MTENVEGVWVWLGIKLSEFNKTKKAGICFKCGKPAKSKDRFLCQGHTNAFHRWQNKRRNLHV